MVASYPTSVKSFGTNVTNLVDVVDAAHPNDLRAEVVAIETALGITPGQSTAATGSGWVNNGTLFANLISRLANIEKGHIATTGVHGLAGVVVGTSDTQAVSNKDLTIGNTFPASLVTLTGTQTLTNKTATGAVLDATSTIGGITGTQVSADHSTTAALLTSWTTYTPTFTGITGGSGTFAYKIVGKTLYIRGALTAGSSAGGVPQVSLPPGLTSVAADQAVAVAQWTYTGGTKVIQAKVSSSSTTIGFLNLDGTTPAGPYSGISYTGVIEVQ